MSALGAFLAIGFRLAVLYVASAALGFLLFVAGFRAGLFGSLDILFYRGLVLIALAGPATFFLVAIAIRRVASLALRDAFAATMVSLSLNLSFLVIVPVTVDRSISIFMLGYMANNPGKSFAPDAMSELFISEYVDGHRQIERRLHEQTVTGNVEPGEDGYRITRRGTAVIRAARLMAWLFDSHAGILLVSAEPDKWAGSDCRPSRAPQEAPSGADGIVRSGRPPSNVEKPQRQVPCRSKPVAYAP